MIRKDYLPFGRPNFSDKEIAAVTKLMRSGWVGMGAETIAFEKELAVFLGVPYVVTVNSCTSGLFLSLLVHGVGPGDDVICPSLTWCSTANVALHLGAQPIFCDVDPNTLCITPELIREKLTAKTRAVIVVHFGGLAVEVEKIRAILPDHVAIIEDAAHALGSRFADRNPVGSSGNLTCFSFYANKNLSTGEGGAISMFDEQMAERLCSLRQNGMPVDAWKRYIRPKVISLSGLTELGYKMNYTDLQACIGRIQLERQSEFFATRLSIAKYYYEHLHALIPPLHFQSSILNPDHARHLFVIQLPIEEMPLSRDEFLLELHAHNVGAGIHYPPLHQTPLYNNSKQPALPNTENVCKRILTLPFSASMSIEDADYVVVKLKELIK